MLLGKKEEPTKQQLTYINNEREKERKNYEKYKRASETISAK